MLLFRSITAGLLGACVYLLAQLPEARGVEATCVEAPAATFVAHRVRPAMTVVDVAHGVSASDVATLVHLDPDERIVSINDVAVDSSLIAGVAIADRVRDGIHYLDLAVARHRASETRRVVVLLR